MSKKKRNSGGRGHPWARLTVGFGEASHRDWLETQACCWAHQKQGHCADRQLVQLKDRGPPLSCWLPTPVPSSGDPGHRAQHSETRSCSTSELPVQEVCKEEIRKQGLQGTKLSVIKALFSASTSLGAHRRRARWVMRVCCTNEPSGEQPRVPPASATPSFFLRGLP